MSNELAKIEPLSDSAFEEVLPRLQQHLAEFKDSIVNAAELLGRMSKPQLRIVKKRFRRIMGADHIERLALLGRSVMGSHLALPESSIRASTFLSLPLADQKKLNDPNHAVEILTPRGVRKKVVSDLTYSELVQVARPYKGLLDATQQSVLALKPAGAVKKKTKATVEADVFEALVFDVPLSAERGEKTAIIYGKPRDGSGSRTSSIEIPLATLKSLVE